MYFWKRRRPWWSLRRSRRRLKPGSGKRPLGGRKSQAFSAAFEKYTFEKYIFEKYTFGKYRIGHLRTIKAKHSLQRFRVQAFSLNISSFLFIVSRQVCSRVHYQCVQFTKSVHDTSQRMIMLIPVWSVLYILSLNILLFEVFDKDQRIPSFVNSLQKLCNISESQIAT